MYSIPWHKYGAVFVGRHPGEGRGLPRDAGLSTL